MLILTSYPSLLVSVPVPFSLPTLFALQPHLNTVRQWIRLFWFVESFQGSYAAYASSPAGTQWLDIISSTCFGIFGLTESVTVWDATAVEGAQLWEEAWRQRLLRDAMVYWFTGLLTSVLSAIVKTGSLYAYRPVPQPGLVDGLGEKEKETAEKERRQKQEESARQFVRERNALLWKIAADGLDMLIPATVLGWVEVEDGQLGVVMTITSILTGWNVWDAVGEELGARKG